MQYFTDPNKLKSQKIISLDTEYTEKNIRKANLLSISVGLSQSTAGVFKPSNLKAVTPILKSAEIIFTQNGAVDWFMLSKSGLELDRSKFIDAMLMDHLVDENRLHGLGAMALRDFSDDYKNQFWGKYTAFNEAPYDEACEYEMRDACYTFYEASKLYSEINNPQLIEHAHRLYWGLFDTEISGLRVDLDLMLKVQTDMGERIKTYLPKLREEFSGYCNLWEMQKWGENIAKLKTEKGKTRVPRPEFSFTSDSQIRWLLYEALELPITEKTKKGAPKTDYDSIKLFSESVPELKTLVEYKDIKNIFATFVEGLLERVEHGRIYPSFNVNGTKNAGRISHSNPNMGNMPKEGPIRNFFLPEDGNVIIGADMEQLEVTVEANLTGDKQLIRIMTEGVSKHDITAEGLGIPRNTAKTVNFALQYGAQAKKLSQVLNCSLSEADYQFNKYWEVYAGVKALKDQIAKQVEDTGIVTTPFGRSKHFPREFKNRWDLAKAQRQGYSALIQGTGADMTNRATYMWAEHLKKTGLGRLWFSVHDEIVSEVTKSYSEQALIDIKGFMEEPNQVVKFKYPVKGKAYGPLNRWSKV